jgi:hypothetical protein
VQFFPPVIKIKKVQKDVIPEHKQNDVLPAALLEQAFDDANPSVYLSALLKLCIQASIPAS